MKHVPRLYLVLAAAALTGQPAASQDRVPWPTHAWRVECDPDMTFILDGEQAFTDSECDPDGGQQHDIFLALASQLEESSVWFDRLGFQAPAVSRVGDRYLVLVSDILENEDSCGVYDGSAQQITVEWACLFAFSDDFESLNTVASARRMFTDLGHTSAPIHELFHGIQRAYAPSSGSADNWFREGTATMAQVAWLQRAEPELVAILTDRVDLAYELFGEDALSPEEIRDIERKPPRWYDHPLDKPADAVQAYKTLEFWKFLGQYFESEDQIAYLREVLESLESSSSVTGLEEVDRALSGLQRGAASPRNGTAGLHDLFPEFVSSVALTPAYFKTEQTAARLRGTEPAREVRVTGSVKPVAATYHRVVVDSLRKPGEAVEIRLDGADDAALHLVVDEDRYDFPGTNRNVFRTLVSAPTNFFVRVVNVSKEAARSEATDYVLTVTLLASNVTFSGTISGSYELETIPSFSVYTDAGALPAACTFTLQLPSPDRRDLVVLAGYLPRPLEPGSYPIRPRASAMSTVGVQASPSCERPGANCAAGLPRATNYAGSLDLTSVSPGLVVGHYTASHRDGEYDASGQFAARLTGVIGGALPPDHPCFAQ